jgi:hypothetical protein
MTKNMHFFLIVQDKWFCCVCKNLTSLRSCFLGSVVREKVQQFFVGVQNFAAGKMKNDGKLPLNTF